MYRWTKTENPKKSRGLCETLDFLYQEKKKIMIYYFSTTGNSLALARKLGEALDDKIISITRTSGTVLEGPAIGLVFPVYYGDVPANVAEFVRSHDFPEGSYVYALGTCGSTWGRSFRTLQQMLEAKGCRLSWSRAVPLIANSTICSRSHIGYDLKKLEKEDAVAREAAEAEKKRLEDHSQEQDSLMAGLFDTWLGRKLGEWYLGIQVAPDRCVRCGACVRLCPVENIHLGEKYAVMGDHCLHCLACLHGCPHQAITVRGRVVLKEDQYRHPGVTAKELER